MVTITLDEAFARLKELRFKGASAKVLDAAVGVLPGPAGFNVSRFDHSPTSLDLELLADSRSLDIARNDRVIPGLAFHVDGQGTSVQPTHRRVLCWNGLFGSLELGQPSVIPHQANDRHLFSVQDLSLHIWNGLAGQAASLRRLPNNRANVPLMLDGALRRAALVPDRRVNLFRAWRDEELAGTAPESEWLVLNSISRAASHDSSLPVCEREALSRVATGLAFRDSRLWMPLSWRNSHFVNATRGFVTAALQPAHSRPRFNN